MTINKSILAYRLFAAASLATIFAAAPIALDLGPDSGTGVLKASTAFAKDGDRGGDDHGGNSGRGGNDDNGRDDHGGRGGDDNGGDDHGGDRDNDNSGPGRDGDDDDGDDNGGRRRGSDDGGRNDDDDDRGAHHVNPRTGAKVEVEGNNVEIVFPNGWKAELENGVFELKNPSGRTVIERPATAEDIARMQAMGI